ncbi:MAG: cobalamin biosynthesis protein, partial [Candidatus Eisenbacteria bacterium]
MDEWGLVLVAAFALDLLLGDPPWPVHPVRMLGAVITRLEKWIRRIGLVGPMGGWALLLVSLGASLGAYLGLRLLVARVHPDLCWVLDAVVAWACIAFRDLFDHVCRVLRAVE